MYKAILVDKDAYLLELCQYIVRNQVLSYFANIRAVAISLYIQFVEQGVNKTIWDYLQHQVFFGG